MSEQRAPQVRIDQLTGMRVVLAPGRAQRPDDFARSPTPEGRNAEGCPFCDGHEDRTPPELWADRPAGGEPDTPGWVSRAVPNLYPVLGVEGVDGADGRTGADDRGDTGGVTSSIDPLRASQRGAEPDQFAARPATGAHEVIVNGPEHHAALIDLSEERLAAAVAGWRARMRAHAEAACRHLIVNEGPDAGASLEHTHAQLYALPFVPGGVARERERVAAYHERTMGGQLLSDVATEEVRRRERVVAIDDDAILICPWASRSPFELRVIPRSAAPRFEDDTAGVGMLRAALQALDRELGRPQLNLWVRTQPRGAESFVWHIDIVPRITIRAGFELGTGVDINTYPPERAAADLRE